MQIQNSNHTQRQTVALAWYDRIRDVDLHASLERTEERIYSYGDDVLDAWLCLAMSLNTIRVCTESLPVL